MAEKAQGQNFHSSRKFKSPIGELTLVGSERGLAAVLWENDDPGRTSFFIVDENSDLPMFDTVGQQLSEYFEGKRASFNLPLDVRGSEFQQEVWSALMKIPFGTLSTYGQVAASVGKPRGALAVGAVTCKNPYGIIVPCHRVTNAAGKLTGFSGGLAVQKQLLALEAQFAPTLAG